MCLRDAGTWAWVAKERTNAKHVAFQTDRTPENGAFFTHPEASQPTGGRERAGVCVPMDDRSINTPGKTSEDRKQQDPFQQSEHEH